MIKKQILKRPFKKFEKNVTNGQCYKTFFYVTDAPNRQAMFFLSGKSLQPFLIFAKKAINYPSTVPTLCFGSCF